MHMNTADKWVIIEIPHGSEVIYKLFITWYGGFVAGDEWRLNSGIVNVEEEGDLYKFHGVSGSSYTGHKNAYGTSGWSSGIANNLVTQAKRIGSDAKILTEEEALEVIKTFLLK